MESVTCNLCGASAAAVHATGRDRLTGVDGEFTLVRCAQCGLVYLNPRPRADEIDRYYPADYLPFLPAIDDEPGWFRRLDRRNGLRRRQAIMRRWVGRPEPGAHRLLDVGCATGIFLQGMAEEGWQVQGVELSPTAADYARRRFGLNVFTGTLEQARLPTGSFDVITLWDVLEHVYDPKATLHEVHRLLKPNGAFVFSLPDLDTIEAKVFGRYWAGLDMPRHLTLFNRATLGRLLRETGFVRQDYSHFTGRHGVFVLSLDFWASEQVASPRLRRWLHRLAASIPARLLTLPYYFVADRLHQSSVVTVFARKTS
jgi:SAM-dependent methyltransferase